MITGIQPQARFLRQHADVLNDLLFLPFRDWVKTAECKTSVLAAALSSANIQCQVICEDDLRWKTVRGAQALLAASLCEFSPTESKVLGQFRAAGGKVVAADAPGWLEKLQGSMAQPSIAVQGPATVRAVVHDQGHRTLVHLLNLDVQRVSTSADKVTPARDVRLVLRVPLRHVRSVRAITADSDGTTGALRFSASAEAKGSLVEMWVPCLQIGTLLLVE